MPELSAEQLQRKHVSSKPETLIRVLHVDDEPGLLKTTKQILETIDPFEVETALSLTKENRRS